MKGIVLGVLLSGAQDGTVMINNEVISIQDGIAVSTSGASAVQIGSYATEIGSEESVWVTGDSDE